VLIQSEVSCSCAYVSEIPQDITLNPKQPNVHYHCQLIKTQLLSFPLSYHHSLLSAPSFPSFTIIRENLHLHLQSITPTTRPIISLPLILTQQHSCARRKETLRRGISFSAYWSVLDSLEMYCSRAVLLSCGSRCRLRRVGEHRLS
jgi:hypothetical protein